MFMGGGFYNCRVALASDDCSVFCVGPLMKAVVAERPAVQAEIPGTGMMEAPISATATVAVPGWPARTKTRVMVMTAEE